MATVTTVDGIQYSINPDAIVVVSDEAAANVCDVLGPTKGTLRLNEASIGLLTRLGIAANFAQLTRSDGSPVWVNGKAASSLRAPLSGEFPTMPTARTVIYIGTTEQAVDEDQAAAVAALNAHGGRL